MAKPPHWLTKAFSLVERDDLMVNLDQLTTLQKVGPFSTVCIIGLPRSLPSIMTLHGSCHQELWVWRLLLIPALAMTLIACEDVSGFFSLTGILSYWACTLGGQFMFTIMLAGNLNSELRRAVTCHLTSSGLTCRCSS